MTAPSRQRPTTSPDADGLRRRDRELDTSFPTGMVTFLFTDIAGSTRLWEQHKEAMSIALARHDALLRQAIEARGGMVFKTVGDAVCAAFALAADALVAAVDAQRALQSTDWGITGPLRVRMALYTGAAESHDGDYFGPPLNRVARLLAAGHGGQTLLSLATAELVRDQLPPGTDLRDLGMHRLKDLIRPEHIFQVVTSDLPSDFPPLPTLDHRPYNLLAQPTPLIGREQEVASVSALLHRADVRLVTLTGPGGTGKTRLALQVAAELLDVAADGIFFVALAPISDPGLIVSTIAQTLGVRESGSRPLLDTLKDHLRDKQLLLLLDNFEQVVSAAPLIGELLVAAPGLMVLITSRMALRLSGEHEVAVQPLSLPDRTRPPDPGHLTQYAAVRLFVERAQAVKADFAITNENASVVIEICHRLDGLPLAIELAAARIKLFLPQALLARLRSPLTVLTAGARDLPLRQQTLRNTIDWSYTLLGASEQTLFARLAVFVSGCTLDVVEAVCNATGDLPIDVVDGMAALHDQSLVQQLEGLDGEPRFTMLEIIREYALERLDQRGEVKALREWHAAYYLALAEQAEREIVEGQQQVWLERLEIEHDNMRAALEWYQTAEDGMEAGLRLAGALGPFWFNCGYPSEGRRWLEGALVRSSRASAVVRAKALIQACDLTYDQGDLARAAVLGEAGVQLLRAVGDKRDIAWALHTLGKVGLAQGDDTRATTFFEESLALFRELGNKVGIAHSLSNIEKVVLSQGDYQQAAALLEESLALFRELGRKAGIAWSLNNLGELARSQGDYQRAAVFYDKSLMLFRELGNKWGIAAALTSRGNVALHQGDHQRAAGHFVESLVISKERGDKRSIASCLEGLAGVAGMTGYPERAARLFGAVEATHQAIGTAMSPGDRIEYDRHVAAARTQMDATAFAAAWAAGRSLSLDQAIAEAKSDQHYSGEQKS
jgi:predicted ATPase/class 3 adenylate cyclase